MSTSPISNLWVNVATFEQDYQWYQVEADGKGRLVHQNPPISYEALSRREITRAHCAVLFRRNAGNHEIFGVFWGPVVLNNTAEIGFEHTDFIGRALQYTLLVEFTQGNDAVEFYSGLLRHWWGKKDVGVIELGLCVASAFLPEIKPEFHLEEFLLNQLRQWKQEASDFNQESDLQSEECLIAAESPERLDELQNYVRTWLLGSEYCLNYSEDEVQPLVVVASNLVKSKLIGIFRATTEYQNHNLPAAWTPTVSPGPEKLPNGHRLRSVATGKPTRRQPQPSPKGKNTGAGNSQPVTRSPGKTPTEQIPAPKRGLASTFTEPAPNLSEGEPALPDKERIIAALEAKIAQLEKQIADAQTRSDHGPASGMTSEDETLRHPSASFLMRMRAFLAELLESLAHLVRGDVA